MRQVRDRPYQRFPVYGQKKKHGLGNVYIGVTGHGAMKRGTAYPGGYYKFGDEGGIAKDGNLLYFIEPDDVAQYDWFAPNKAAGLTQAVNQGLRLLYIGCAGKCKDLHH